MSSTTDKIDRGFDIVAHNVKFLFALAKQNYFIKKSDFIRKTKITRKSITGWEVTGRITPSNLQILIDYFNEKLTLDLKQYDLMHEHLSETYLDNKKKKYDHPIIVKDASSDYFTDEERELLNNFRRLPKSKKEIILRLLQDFE